MEKTHLSWTQYTTKSQRMSQYLTYFVKSTPRSVLPTKYYGGKLNINIDKRSESATGIV